ncbi:TIGR03943 family putative permease subunit [Kutzneria kofuensis]|uniref:TIGR03943 family putative permease subunit n=1 Tax=Kutzneria kofuensis TaxID=103725 RepID=UPI0035E45E7A
MVTDIRKARRAVPAAAGPTTAALPIPSDPLAADLTTAGSAASDPAAAGSAADLDAHAAHPGPAAEPAAVGTGSAAPASSLAVAEAVDHPHGDLALAAASHSHDDGHGHSHGSARSAWMLLMPVLAIFLIAPPALGADSVNRAGGRTVASEQRQDQVIKTKFPPLPAASVVPMRMADVATRAAWDSTNSLNGRTLELTGFVVHDAAGVYVARLVITCCAADAMPVKARLVGAEGLADDEWITVTGKVRPDSAVQADNYVPVFDVTTVKKIGTPSDPYEY